MLFKSNFLFINTNGFDCNENGNFFGIVEKVIDDDKLLLFPKLVLDFLFLIITYFSFFLFSYIGLEPNESSFILLF